MGQINGQYRQIGVLWLDEKMKNKKIRKNFQRTIFILSLKFLRKKIFFTKIEKRQRSGGRVKKGHGIL